MKIKRTSYLRVTIFGIGFIVLGLCVFWLPQMATYFAKSAPEFAHLRYPLLIGIYLTTLPFFMALYQAFLLLRHIDQDKPFSNPSVHALKIIKICALSIGILYIIGLVFIHTENAGQPGISLLALMITFASFIISVVAAILQSLIKKAVALKEETDLTI